MGNILLRMDAEVAEYHPLYFLPITCKEIPGGRGEGGAHANHTGML